MTAALMLLALAALVPTAAVPSDRWPELRADASSGTGRDVTRNRISALAGMNRGAAVIRGMVGAPDGRVPRPSPADLLDAAAVLDLTAACLRAGMPAAGALGAAAQVAPPVLAEAMRATAGRLALGAAGAWSPLADAPLLGELAVLARRSADSGAALASGAAELAGTRRAEAGDAAEATAERAGVLIAGPLALCFLPAFVVLGLVPTVAGLAETMLGGVIGVGP